MQWIRIHIPDESASAQALVELGRRGRIDCYPDNVYMVPEPALKLLGDLGISFVELSRGGFDYAQKTLRDTLAAHAQRRTAGQPREAQADA